MQPDSADPDDDIDRKSLRALRDRFLALNQSRLEALRSRLPEERRTFFDAVPVLLHSNHAALPGFVDFDTPCGIERYAPDRRALNAVRRIALSFVLERFVERRTQIQALYVTPLPGEVLELCVVSTLATHAALNEKVARVVRYARDHGVALTTSLIDPAEEHARRSRQRTPSLARDEFYRSAILLAGRYPIWWLVPPQLDHAHDAYCARLKSQRFIGRDETFDLGRADPVPASECLSAGIELLDAALAVPYTHLPSLMLLESYAAGATVEPLAHFYKERIWRGDAAVDSSTLLDEAIAAYCAERNDLERLTLARDCRRGILREPTLAELQRENARVNTELQRAHRNLTLLATEQRTSNDVLIRLHAIGERIAQWTERRDQAITRINPALWPTRVAGHVRVDTQGDQWRLQDGDTTVFAAPRFAATIAWAHSHRLSLENLRVTDARRHACARMIELLTRYADGTTAQPETLLILNAEESPKFASRSPGEAIISDWDDPLDFSGFHTSLIAGVDLLDVRDDGIVATGRAGDDGLIDALVGLLFTPAANVRVQCVGGEYERAIEARVAELVSQMSAAFHRDAIGRFVFALAGGFVVIERNAARFAAHRCSNDVQLFEALAAPSRSGLRVDARNIRLSGLSHLCGVAESTQDTVLIHEQRGTVVVLLALRDGTIHRFTTQPRPVNELAADLDDFVAREVGNHVIAIYVAQANAAPRRVAAGASKRTGAQPASRRNLLTLLREKYAADMEPARRPTVA